MKGTTHPLICPKCSSRANFLTEVSGKAIIDRKGRLVRLPDELLHDEDGYTNCMSCGHEAALWEFFVPQPQKKNPSRPPKRKPGPNGETDQSPSRKESNT